MPGKGLLRSLSSKSRSPTTSKVRKEGLGRSSSSRYPSPPPDRGRRRPPPSTAPHPPLNSGRSQSHESSERWPHATLANPARREGFVDESIANNKIVKRSSSQRHGYSSPTHGGSGGGTASPMRSDRPPLSAWGRRGSPVSSHSEARLLSSPGNSQQPRWSSLHDYGHGDEYGSNHERSDRRGRERSASVTAPLQRHETQSRHREGSSHEHSESPSARPPSRRHPSSEDVRSGTPDRYKPRAVPGKQGNSQTSPHNNNHIRRGERDEEQGFFDRLPGRFMSYAGFHALSENADKAKEWVDYLLNLKGTPSEIRDLSAKAYTARDTINQIQQSLVARPDLLEGESGSRLRDQIEETCKGAEDTLKGMTKMLSALSESGGEEGSVRRGLEEYWKSYRYKTEFKEEIEKLDAELQGQLQQLSLLMVNVYSRALRKPAPPGSLSMPPPAPLPIEVTAGAALNPIPTRPKAPTPEGRSPEPPRDGRAASRSRSKTESTLPDDGKTEGHAAEARKGPESPHPAMPTIEVQPPTQPTDDGLPLDGAHPRYTPHSLGQNFEAYSPLLTPDDGNSSADDYDDNQTVGDGLLPLAGDQKPVGTGKRVPVAPNPQPEEETSSTHEDLEKEIRTRDAESVRTTEDQPPKPNRERSQEDMQQYAKNQLLDAAWDGDIEQINTCLRYIPSTVTDSHGLTPLHLACERDNLAIAILLLDRGSPGSPQSSRGITPLHLASRYASATTVEMLLERAKVEPNVQTRDGKTALHFAASVASDEDEERREVIRVLRDWGADPLMRDVKKETPRDVAQGRGFWKTAGTLKRMERRWEEGQPGGDRKGERLGQSHSGGSGSRLQESSSARTSSSQGHGHGHGGGGGGKEEEKRGNWLQRHGFVK